jgi:hypothetical protein
MIKLDMEWSTERAISDLEMALEQLKKNRAVGLSAELLDAIEALDEHYKEFCSELDIQDDLEPGTTYNDDCGVPIEFYIEADDWHNISLAFRNMRKSQ